MKELLEQLRSNKGRATFNAESIGESKRSELGVEHGEQAPAPLTAFNWYDQMYPQYERMGASVFYTKEGKLVNKVSSIKFDAGIAQLGDQISNIDANSISAADFQPHRVGTSFPISKELIASGSDKMLLSYVYAGVEAINRKVTEMLIEDALANATQVGVGDISLDSIVELQKSVNSDGVLFGASAFIQDGKKSLVGSHPLIVGENSWGRAVEGTRCYAFENKDSASQVTYGYGDFRFAAVVEYSDYEIILDRYTLAKSGEIEMTITKMVDAKIIDPLKFATITYNLPIVLKEPSGATAEDGGTIVLTALFTGAASLIWQKSTDGGTVFADVAGETNSKLVLSGVAQSDEGLYRLKATNPKGDSFTEEALVEVQVVGIDWSVVDATATAITLMQTNDVDPANVTGTGAAGRILKSDVQDYLENL